MRAPKKPTVRVENGIYEDYELSWRYIVLSIEQAKDNTIDQLDALFEAWPLKCTTEVIDGKPILNWPPEKRVHILRAWIDDAHRNHQIRQKQKEKLQDAILDMVYPRQKKDTTKK